MSERKGCSLSAIEKGRDNIGWRLIVRVKVNDERPRLRKCGSQSAALPFFLSPPARRSRPMHTMACGRLLVHSQGSPQGCRCLAHGPWPPGAALSIVNLSSGSDHNWGVLTLCSLIFPIRVSASCLATVTITGVRLTPKGGSMRRSDH